MSIITPSEASQEAMTAKTQSVPPVERTGGSGSIVTVTPIVTTGTHIADIDVDGTTSGLYAPTASLNGLTVIANTSSLLIPWNASTFSATSGTVGNAVNIGSISFSASHTTALLSEETAYGNIRQMIKTYEKPTGYFTFTTTSETSYTISGITATFNFTYVFKSGGTSVLTLRRSVISSPFDVTVSTSPYYIGLDTITDFLALDCETPIFENSTGISYDSIQGSLQIYFDKDSVSASGYDLTIALDSFLIPQKIRKFSPVILPYAT